MFGLSRYTLHRKIFLIQFPVINNSISSWVDLFTVLKVISINMQNFNIDAEMSPLSSENHDLSIYTLLIDF